MTQRPLQKGMLSWALWALVGLLCIVTGSPAVAQKKLSKEERYKKYEIRVIRPKYMTKRGHFEIGGQISAIMNQSFIYSFLATGLLDYHFSEQFAFEIGGAYGFSIDKQDKTTLRDEFDIKTQILRTQYMFNGGLLWTPIYGKTQLSSGRLIYFDTFITLAGGMTGVSYDYEQCIQPDADIEPGVEVPPQPPAATKAYPTGIIGIGQKFFTSRDFSFRWDVRDHFFPYNVADGSCTPDIPGATKLHQNVTLQMGVSKFF